MIYKNLRIACLCVGRIETEQDFGLWLRKWGAGPPIEIEIQIFLLNKLAIFYLASLKKYNYES